MSRWSAFFTDSLTRTDIAKLRRTRRIFEWTDTLDFGSNDYLCLRHSHSVLAALRDYNGAVWGAGASPVLSGTSRQTLELERALAEFSGMDSALVFSSGFACNMGTISCLTSAADLILSDQLNHASLIDGCRLSKAVKVVYPHGDIDFVRRFLKADRHKYDKVLLLSESIFSMDGDSIALQELAALAQEFDCGLAVDEAHAVGVYGNQGSGLLEELGLQHHALLKLGTLSKALGGIGGYVCSDGLLTQFLVNHCRSYLFSTAVPNAVLAAASASLQQLRSMASIRLQLRASASNLRRRVSELGIKTLPGDSPIVPLIFGDELQTVRLAQRLLERQIYVPAIRPPTVPVGTSRLRVSLNVGHTPEQIDRLVNALNEVV